MGLLIRCLLLGAALTLLLTLPARAQSKLKAVASFSILADMVNNIAGPRLEVTALVGPDIDAHSFQPSPADARTLATANVLVINGLGFEGWIDRLARAAPFRGQRIVASEGIQPLTALSGGHSHDHGASSANPSTRAPLTGPKTVADPHCWQDLACGQRYVTTIAAGLALADAAYADQYRQRSAAYTARLAELDRWVRSEIARVPADKRKVITGHDAFGYFARAYGVSFLAPAGISSESEPSAREVAALIAQARREGIRAIFLENMTNPALIQQVARDAGAVVGPTLYVDALSKPNGPAPTYEAMFRHNVSALVAGMLRN